MIKRLDGYKKEVWPRRIELISLIRDQEKLCGEECTEILQKHLNICNKKYGCTKNIVSIDCRYKENGRCSHYYEIERAEMEIERYDYYEYEENDKITDLEIWHERALAVKEDRLQKYKDDLYDDFY